MIHLIRIVLPGLDPGIHAVMYQPGERRVEWIAGSSPAMTITRTTTNVSSSLLKNFARAKGW